MTAMKVRRKLAVGLLLAFLLAFGWRVQIASPSEAAQAGVRSGNTAEITLAEQAVSAVETSVKNSTTQVILRYKEVQFAEWKTKKRTGVQFVNPPEVDSEGFFCVINPVYRFDGKEMTEFVEDGSWYQHGFKGGRGAILIGCGNGRPPRLNLVAELYVESDALRLRNRILFGGSKAAAARYLFDLNDGSEITKVGVAIGERSSFSSVTYPGIWTEEAVISSEEVEKLPKVKIKPNWIMVNYALDATESDELVLGNPVRVVWFEIEQGTGRLVRIEN